MRIDAMNKVSQLYQTGNVKKTSKANGTEKTSDRLEISQAGKDFQAVKQAVAAAPDVRADLVNSIKQKMNDGTYHVSNEDLAEKLLSGYVN